MLAQERSTNHQSWLRGSVLKLKRYAMRHSSESNRSPSPSCTTSCRRPLEVSEATSQSSFSQADPTRGCRSITPNLSELIHEHTGFQRRETVLQEERRANRKARESPCPGESKAANVAELVTDRLQACAGAVRTPRIPGKRKEEQAEPPLTDTFCQQGLLMEVPDYLTKLTGASRGGERAVPRLKPPDLFDTKKKQPAARKHKSGTGALASVTVPISAKQWLLQAIGLRDNEIREMFAQMESVPQLAGDHVREVRAEWEAMEARVNRVPPEADLLVKDRALLEKVRGLIVRFLEYTDSQVLVDEPPSKNTDKLEQERTEEPEHEIKEVESVNDELDATSRGQSESELSPPSNCCCEHTMDKTSPDSHKHTKDTLPDPLKHMRPSFIPMEDYVINKYVVQPELLGRPDCKFTYSPSDKRWYTVVFPALQPGRREDVQLLEDWLQRAIQKNHCEKADGRFENVEAAFVLHSIAFLEIVRQVDIHCEERGNLLLHLWRQLLRIFNQVLVRAEPKLNATEEELKRLRCDLEVSRDRLTQLLSDHDFYKEQYDVIVGKLKERDFDLRRIKRCRLCCTENMTPRSRAEYLANLKKRSISFRYTSSAEFTTPPPPPTEEELKKQEEERAKQAAEEERKKFEESAGREGEETTEEQVTTAEEQAPVEEVTEEQPAEEATREALETPEGEAPTAVLGFKDEACQTDGDKGLRRCQSAPPNIFPPTKVGEGRQKEEVEQGKGGPMRVELRAELSPEDLQNLAGIAGKKKEGGERLKEYETLAADTIELLDSLPMEGAMAEHIELLLKKYCEITGTVLSDKVREKFMQRSKSISKRATIVGEGAPKVSFAEGRPSEMRKSRKSKGSKWGLQLKSYVPLGFAKMMKIYNPPKNVKFFNVRQLTKLIASVYVNKIVADAVDDSCNNERQTCCEFVYDFMLNQYGLKGLSESAIFGVFKTVKTLMTNKEIDKHHKIRLFSRFVGMDENNNYSEPDLYLYLKLLQKASSKVGVLLPSDQDDGLCYLNAAQFSFIVDEPNLVSYFGSQAAAMSFLEKYCLKNAVTERASPEIRKIVKESEVRKVDWDLLLEAILAVYPHKMDTIQEERRKSIHVSKPVPKEKATELENLFIAGDANQDGVLTFNEFKEIVTTADPSMSAQSALRMFRETLLMMPDGGDSISPQAFAQIAYNHGIEAPSSTVFDLLKKTWAQVQDDIDQEKVSANKDEFDFSKEVLQDLMHQKVDVNSTVQTFRQFVLKFCGNDEEEAQQASHEEEEQPFQDDAEAAELKPVEAEAEPVIQEEPIAEEEPLAAEQGDDD